MSAPQDLSNPGAFCFPHDSGILVPTGSPLIGHAGSLHTDSLGLGDPVWVRSTNGRDKGHQKVGFSPLLRLRSSVVMVGEGTQVPEPGKQQSHLCFCHGLAVC